MNKPTNLVDPGQGRKRFCLSCLKQCSQRWAGIKPTQGEGMGTRDRELEVGMGYGSTVKVVPTLGNTS